MLPNSVAGVKKGGSRGVNYSHLSYLGNEGGWTQNKRWYSAWGAAPRAIPSKDCNPPPFVRPQSIILWLDQSGEPHEASSQNFLALHTFSSSAAVANMQVCCVASRCAARRRGPLRPFLRSAQWRSLHLMCRLPALHRCPTPSRSSRGDLLAQLSAGAVRWRCPLALCAFASAPAPIGCIDSLSSARSHQLAVIAQAAEKL